MIFYIGCVMILLSLIAPVCLRRYLVRYTTDLISSLEEMIAGTKELVFDEENEFLMSKVQVKLRQLYEITERKHEKSSRDKEVLEGIVSDISHQVKTPIANLRMYHSILRSRELSGEERQRFLEAMDAQTTKLDILMESMIEMSRMEVGMIQVEPVYQDIMPLIEQVVCDAAMKAEKKNLSLVIDCDERIKAVYDRKWTVEALGNILDNAVKYTPEGGHIAICVSLSDFFAKIEVKDNGKGIEEAHFAEVFKRFYREADVQQVEGVGIGLFLAREIIRMQKGYIDLRSEVGRGSSFYVYLPAG